MHAVFGWHQQPAGSLLRQPPACSLALRLGASRAGGRCGGAAAAGRPPEASFWRRAARPRRSLGARPFFGRQDGKSEAQLRCLLDRPGRMPQGRPGSSVVHRQRGEPAAVGAAAQQVTSAVQQLVPTTASTTPPVAHRCSSLTPTCPKAAPSSRGPCGMTWMATMAVPRQQQQQRAAAAAATARRGPGPRQRRPRLRRSQSCPAGGSRPTLLCMPRLLGADQGS